MDALPRMSMLGRDKLVVSRTTLALGVALTMLLLIVAIGHISSGAADAALVKAEHAVKVLNQVDRVNTIVAATHGVFAPGVEQVLAQNPIRALFVTDSTEPIASIANIRVERVSLAPTVLDVLGRLQEGRSIQEFLAQS
jgi:hypothetical protein